MHFPGMRMSWGNFLIFLSFCLGGLFLSQSNLLLFVHCFILPPDLITLDMCIFHIFLMSTQGASILILYSLLSITSIFLLSFLVCYVYTEMQWWCLNHENMGREKECIDFVTISLVISLSLSVLHLLHFSANTSGVLVSRFCCCSASWWNVILLFSFDASSFWDRNLTTSWLLDLTRNFQRSKRVRKVLIDISRVLLAKSHKQ